MRSCPRPSLPSRAGRGAEACDRRCRRPCREQRAKAAARARDARRHRDGPPDRARGSARRHGRGDAPRPRRVPDGRGGRRVPGRLQGQPGPARGVRRQAGDRHPDHRVRLHRPGRGRGHGRPEADRRVHDLELRHAGDRPHHQFGRQDALHGRRRAGLPDRVPRPQRRGRPRRRPAQPGIQQLVRPLPGPEGGRPLQRRRRQGPAQGGHPRPQPGRVPRERGALRAELRRAQAGRLRRADRQGQGPARRVRTSPSPPSR